MSSSNPVEHRLLARCAKFGDGTDADDQIQELLEKRFSVKGDQKNFLVLEGTDGGISRVEIDNKRKKKKGKKSFNLIASINNTESDSDSINNNNNNNNDGKDLIHLSTKRENKFDPLTTRNEFKTFIKTNLNLQKKVSKEIRKSIKQNSSFINKFLNNDSKQLSNFYSGKCGKLLKFEDFIEMNLLWQGYMKELLNFNDDKEKLGNVNNITNKLTTSEFVGSLITVTHSRIIGNIGMKGIVIWESQFNYIIIVPSYDNWKNEISITDNNNNNKINIKKAITAKDLIGGIRIINKKTSRFKIEVDIDETGQEYLEFVIIGDRITFKSYDRSNRKFKSKNVTDFFI